MTGEINVFIRRLELVGCREPAVKLSAGYGQMDPVGRENGAMPCRQDKIPKHRADRYFGVTSEETAKPLKCKTDCFSGSPFYYWNVARKATENSLEYGIIFSDKR